MSAEHRNDIHTATQQRQQQEQRQATSIFSDVVTVISGARQSANQEFNKFWDKYISKRNTNNDTSSSQHLPIHFTEYDLACIRERKNIQGRLIPVSNKNQDEVSPPTDKDIIRSSEKRKISLTEDDLTSNTSPRTKVNKRYLHASNLSQSSQSSSPQAASYASPSTYLIPSPPPIFYNPQPIPSSPEKDTTVLSLPSQLLPITSSPYRPARYINKTRTSVSPVQLPARVNTIRTSLTPTQSPVRRTAIQTSVSPMNYSPERFKNPIVTGSSKSVQTLASEIAIKLSPGGLNPFSPRKESNISTTDDEDPFQSTPLVKTSTDISARKIAVPKSRRFIIEEEDERITRIQNRMMKQVNEHINNNSRDIVIDEDKEDERAHNVQNTIIIEDAKDERVNNVQKPRINEDEIDERLNCIQNKINAIESAVTEFISSPVDIISPKPIPTSLENKIAALEDMTLLDVDEIPLPPLPSYLSLNHTPSPSPPPLPETIVSLPRRSFSPLPRFVPSPSRPLPADTFNQNSTPRFSPYSKTQSNVKKALTRQHSTINIDKTSLGNSSPNKTEPTLNHKLKMRSLVDAIPFCKLRKTDTLTGPDGITRPNPFWKEIYGGRKL